MKILALCCALAMNVNAKSQPSKPPKEQPRPAGYELYVSAGKSFECNLPKTWQKTTAGPLAPDARLIDGLEIYTQDKNSVPVRISADYYSKDNKLYKTADLFIAALSKPTPYLAIKGEEYGPVTETELAGATAKQFERKKFDFLPPGSANPQKIAMSEKFLVLPAKNGFYVLRYHFPEASAKEFLPVFERVSSSFKPLK